MWQRCAVPSSFSLLLLLFLLLLLLVPADCRPNFYFRRLIHYLTSHFPRSTGTRWRSSFFFLFFFCFFLVFFLLPSASSTIRSASLWFIFFLSYRVHWSATQLLIEGFIFQLDPIELVGDFFFFFFLFLGSSFQFLVAQLWFLFRSTSFIEGVMKRRWSRSMFTVFNDIAVP